MEEITYRSSRVCRLLGNPVTFQILTRLVQSRHTPAQLSKAVGRSVSTVSIHLGKLRTADLVRYEKRGTRVEYWAKYPRPTSRLLRTLEEIVEAARSK